MTALSIGLPTLLRTQRLQADITALQTESAQLQSEAVTGRAADIRAATSGDVGRVQSIEQLIADAERFDGSLRAAAVEYDFVQTTLEPFQSAANDVAIDVSSAVARGDESALAAAVADAEAELRSIFERLNTPFAETNLFSGAATDTAPLGDVDTFISQVRNIFLLNNTPPSTASDIDIALDDYFESPTGTFQTVVYQGSTTPAPTREVAPGRRIGPEVTPLDPAIRDTIRGLAAIVAAGPTIGDASEAAFGARQEAADLLLQSSDALVSLRADLGRQEAEIDLLTTRNTANETALNELLNSIIGVDQFEAASRLNGLSTQLEAAFLITGRVQSLSLANFL